MQRKNHQKPVEKVRGNKSWKHVFAETETYIAETMRKVSPKQTILYTTVTSLKLNTELWMNLEQNHVIIFMFFEKLLYSDLGGHAIHYSMWFQAFQSFRRKMKKLGFWSQQTRWCESRTLAENSRKKDVWNPYSVLTLCFLISRIDCLALVHAYPIRRDLIRTHRYTLVSGTCESWSSCLWPMRVQAGKHWETRKDKALCVNLGVILKVRLTRYMRIH